MGHRRGSWLPHLLTAMTRIPAPAKRLLHIERLCITQYFPYNIKKSNTNSNAASRSAAAHPHTIHSYIAHQPFTRRKDAAQPHSKSEVHDFHPPSPRATKPALQEARCIYRSQILPVQREMQHPRHEAAVTCQ
jgi:hypothetical protein